MTERADFFGGGQRSLLDLARALRVSPFPPIVVLPGPGPLTTSLHAAAIETRLLPLPPPGLLRLVPIMATLRAIVGLVRRENVAVLHSDSPRAALYAGLASRLTRRPHLWHLRASVTRSPLSDRVILALTDRVVAVSHAAAARSAPVARFRAKDVVPTGVPITPRLEMAEARRVLGLPGDAFILGVVGRVEPDKGGDDAIAAFAALRTAQPTALLAFLGAFDECGSWMAALRRRAAETGLEDGIRFLGERSDAARHLGAFDLILHPSRHEALPRVLIEALQAGVPAVAYAVGGVPEVIEDARTGVLVAPGDARALAAAVVALAANPMRRGRLARAGPARARERFSIESMSASLTGIYSDLAGIAPAGARREVA
jgi:glycosyltransferase involved in cell wall biosynthesis